MPETQLLILPYLQVGVTGAQKPLVTISMVFEGTLPTQSDSI
jgi:hypothetical protein